MQLGHYEYYKSQFSQPKALCQHILLRHGVNLYYEQMWLSSNNRTGHEWEAMTTAVSVQKAAAANHQALNISLIMSELVLRWSSEKAVQHILCDTTN